MKALLIILAALSSCSARGLIDERETVGVYTQALLDERQGVPSLVYKTGRRCKGVTVYIEAGREDVANGVTLRLAVDVSYGRFFLGESQAIESGKVFDYDGIGDDFLIIAIRNFEQEEPSLIGLAVFCK